MRKHIDARPHKYVLAQRREYSITQKRNCALAHKRGYGGGSLAIQSGPRVPRIRFESWFACRSLWGQRTGYVAATRPFPSNLAWITCRRWARAACAALILALASTSFRTLIFGKFTSVKRLFVHQAWARELTRSDVRQAGARRRPLLKALQRPASDHGYIGDHDRRRVSQPLADVSPKAGKGFRSDQGCGD